MPSCISITHLYSYFYARNRLVMTFGGLVIQGILSLENKSAIVKSTRKLSKKSPAGEKYVLLSVYCYSGQ